jgi:Tfp pilus assembly protein PilF
MKQIIPIIFLLLQFSSCGTNQTKDPTPEERKAQIYFSQGTNNLILKDYKEALTNLLKAKSLQPKDTLIRTNLGMAYFLNGQVALAEAELKDAVSLDDKNGDAKTNLATIYLSKKKHKDARHLYEEVLAILTYPNQFRTYYNLALLDIIEGDRKSAFENLAKSIEEKEDFCLSHFKLGELYSEEYKFNDALASFRKAGKGTCVSEPAPLYSQAVALMNLGKKTEAKNKFAEVISKFPRSEYNKMATNQLKQIEQNPQNNDDNISTNTRQTEVIPESPKF